MDELPHQPRFSPADDARPSNVTMQPQGLLNEFATYDAVATEQSRSLFLGGRPAYREALHTGLLLCRFQPRSWSPTRACEWWMLFQAFVLSNGQTTPGLGDFLFAQNARIDVEGRLVTAADLQLTCMERNSRFTLVRLIRSAYGFMGPTVPQRPEPCGGVLPLRGGEFRVWIPGLEAHAVQPVPVPVALRAEMHAQPDEAGIAAPAETPESDVAERGEAEDVR